MPIPLIIGAAVVTGIYGAYKGAKGVMDRSEASDLNQDAKSMVENAQELVDSQRKVTNAAIEGYGARKLRAFNGVIADFIETFGKLKNVEVSQSPELDKLKLGDFSTQTLHGLRQDYQALKDAGLGIGAGLGSGAALAFGAYNGTMLLATAGTGTAISTLGGVAATNATLAWLGGGTLAAGGYGMAGGMMVLGGIVAAPALAIFGYIVGNKGEEALNNARTNMETAKSVSADATKLATQLNAIESVTDLANGTFSIISTKLRRSVSELEKIIESEGRDFAKFEGASQKKVLRTVKFAQLIKAMIDTPILEKNGELVLSTEKRVQDIVEALA